MSDWLLHLPADFRGAPEESMRRVLTRIVADAVVVALLLFVSAGTLAWWRAWVLVAVLLVIRTATAITVYRIHPALLHDRAKLPIHGGQPWSDRLLLLGGLATGFAGLPVIAALDVFHWHLLPKPAPLLAGLGLALYALGWGIKAVALRTNAFATTAVRLQSERESWSGISFPCSTSMTVTLSNTKGLEAAGCWRLAGTGDVPARMSAATRNISALVFFRNDATLALNQPLRSQPMLRLPGLVITVLRPIH